MNKIAFSSPNSIQKKFTLLILCCIFLSTCLVGCMAYWYISYFQKADSDQIMSMTCRQEADSLNRQFSSVNDAVSIYSNEAMKRLPSSASLMDEAFLDAYMGDMEAFMSDVVKNTVDIRTYFMRLAPGVTADDGKAGFFYTRRNLSDSFAKEASTDVSKYDPTDTEHVGWFYQPKEEGKAIWLKPYFNKNVNIYMISYVAPLYKDGHFIGVAGMDVDFNAVIDDISRISPYKSSVTSLLSSKGEVYYSPQYSPGTLISDYSPDLQAVVDDMRFSISDNLKQTYSYTFNGKEKTLSFKFLQNGMVLTLTTDTEEINEPQRMLLQGIVLITVSLAFLAALITYLVSHRITGPLKQLTYAADELAAGNLDVELPEPGDDEVGVLSRSFAIAMERQKDYIAGMQNKAYQDSLTHVKNKAAYELEKDRLKREMQDGGASYALLMLDINDLKKMNDNYGHEKGDVYLLNCSQIICQVFRHSPVYRIGGDEFLVLLENHDYDCVEDLLQEMERRMAETRSEKDPWNRVSVARGLGVCQSSDTDPDEVFKRADEAMYAHKKMMKVGR